MQSILLSERKPEILISTFRTHPIYVICNDFWWSVVNPRENEAMLGTYLGFFTVETDNVYYRTVMYSV